MHELDQASKAYVAKVISRNTFRILEGAASQVSGIGAGANTALFLVQATQTAERNKEDFKELARIYCMIMAALIKNIWDSGNGPEDAKLKRDVIQLQGDMKFIKECIERYGNGSKRLLSENEVSLAAYKEAMKNCLERIEEAPKMSSLKHNTELRQGIKALLDNRTTTRSEKSRDQGATNTYAVNRTEIENYDGQQLVVTPGGFNSIGTLNMGGAPPTPGGQAQGEPTSHRGQHMPEPPQPHFQNGGTADNSTHIVNRKGKQALVTPGGHNDIGTVNFH